MIIDKEIQKLVNEVNAIKGGGYTISLKTGNTAYWQVYNNGRLVFEGGKLVMLKKLKERLVP
jgi:hypothetical protein